MTEPLRLVILATGYVGGAALSAYGSWLFWLPHLTQEQVLLTGLPLVGGIGLMWTTDEFRKRTAARSA